MMDTVEILAPAKINLCLDVLGKREDGYHEVRTVMTAVPVCDELTVRRAGAGITVSTDRSFIPNDERNIAWKAAAVFFEAACVSGGAVITIKKRIPVQAGMGGGSADGAAVLRALNALYGDPMSTEELIRTAAKVGTDVAFCAAGGTALGTGRGEIITPLPDLPDCGIAIVKPSFSVSTPKLFARIDSVNVRYRPDTDGLADALKNGDIGGVARRCFNVFEQALPPRDAAVVEEIKGALLAAGAMGAAMTGTGSAVFAVFNTGKGALGAREEIKKQWPDSYFMARKSARQV